MASSAGMVSFPLVLEESSEVLIKEALQRDPQRFCEDVEVRQRQQFSKGLAAHGAFGLLLLALWCLRPSTCAALRPWLLEGLVMEALLALAAVALAAAPRRNKGSLLPRANPYQRICTLRCARVAMGALRSWWGLWGLQLVAGAMPGCCSALRFLFFGCALLWPAASVALHIRDQREQADIMRGVAAAALLSSPAPGGRGRLVAVMKELP
mmetsp:Transcript_43413/g.138136  ORF Transcript_43413/g.138136 Transcript_43413/m.138136 type:complete len:210 (-) Transcript_43413:149-778(-)